jgi:Zn-dependent protease
MARCSLCGKEDLCFNCPYCNGVYCSEHRLPESHGCPGLQLAKERAKKKLSDAYSETYQKPGKSSFGRGTRSMAERQRFSKRELRDLGIAVVLVILVGISIMGRVPIGILNGILIVYSLAGTQFWWFPVVVILIFLASFMLHELAHKFVAQHYGMWSEFRMSPQGYYLSAIAILFAFPIFGTGVVYTSGTTSREENAKSNLAGPLSNFILAFAAAALVIFSALVLRGVPYPFSFIAQYTISLNAVLGLFNMIPIQPFDGATVMQWNKAVWATVAVSLLVLLIFGYFLLPAIV